MTVGAAEPPEAALLDASALLALLHGEPGSDTVVAALPSARMAAVNLEEVVATLTVEGMPEEEIRRALDPLRISVEPFTEAMALTSGLLRRVMPAGLGLADRACMAVARMLGLPVLTTDRAWKGLERVVGIEVRLIR